MRDRTRTIGGGAMLLLALSACGLAFAFFAVRSETLGSGDAILHVVICRAALHRPELLLDVWGRPVFTVLYAIPAAFGLGAVRALSVVVSLVTCACTYGVAREFGWRRAAAVIPLLAFQPWYFSASYDGLTELVFAALIAGSLLTYARGELVVCTILVSLLSMARWEGSLLIFIFSIMLMRRSLVLGVLVYVPHILWNTFNAAYFHDWIGLLFPFDTVFRDPTFMPKDPELADLAFYPRRAALIVGPGLAFLSQLGVLADCRRRLLPAACLVSMLVFYALAAWRMPGIRGAAIPLDRYITGLAPLIALFGLRGMNALLDRDLPGRWLAGFAGIVVLELAIAVMLAPTDVSLARAHLVMAGVGCAALALVPHASRLRATSVWSALVTAVPVCVIASCIVHTLRRVEPHRLAGIDRTAADAAIWLRQSARTGDLVLVSEPFFAYYVSGPNLPGTPLHYEWMNTDRVTELPHGGWVAWERRFSEIFFFKVPRSWLDEQAELILRQSFGEHGGDICLYERVPGDLVSDDAEALQEHYWPDVSGSGQSPAIASVSDE